ncbi:hypothetical protein B484DRAFT_454950 [Ochromonadaceae sp. CCMP2298]|nr:hypothetical protein B484DRAFT_454950 [Ochromonadaceae sp. CCMP2298]
MDLRLWHKLARRARSSDSVVPEVGMLLGMDDDSLWDRLCHHEQSWAGSADSGSVACWFEKQQKTPLTA